MARPTMHTIPQRNISSRKIYGPLEKGWSLWGMTGYSDYLSSTRPETRVFQKPRHPGEGRDPGNSAAYWIPAFAGMTIEVFEQDYLD